MNKEEFDVIKEMLYYLNDISKTLHAMKEQEKEYWDTWKKAKENEQN